MDQISHPHFSTLKIPENAYVIIKDKILTVKKWNWDYQECLAFQKQSQALVRNNRDYRIYIFCNHPHCFTVGRGNERGRDDLIEFDQSTVKDLSFPLYPIHRGGGITFHHPGQWIFYPIVSINQSYTLDDHMCWLLKSVKENLKNYFALEKVMATKKLLGVWHERKKLASIGVGLNRFVTEHGLALNLIHDKKMFSELIKINPCGMDSRTYMAVDQLIGDHLINDEFNLIERFHKTYFSQLFPR